MERFKEPELMICPEQVKAYAEADFSSSDSNLIKSIDHYISEIEKNIDNKSLIVDIGCGSGNITELLARRWPSSKIIGIDGSEEMLSSAKAKAQNVTSLKNIKYIKEELASFSDGKNFIEGSADLIVSNSLLHHIHDPSQFWLALVSIGSKGAVIFQRDLRRPNSKEHAVTLLKKHLPSAPSILKRDYLASLHAAFTIDEVKSQLEKAGLCQLKVFEVDDRYLDVIGVL